jgi:hypothetical protein
MADLAVFYGDFLRPPGIGFNNCARPSEQANHRRIVRRIAFECGAAKSYSMTGPRPLQRKVKVRRKCHTRSRFFFRVVISRFK